MSEDETATITVVDGETELVSRTVTQDCDDEVTTTTTDPGRARPRRRRRATPTTTVPARRC